MKALEEKIISEGVVLNGDVLKVGSFLNQQLDTEFLFEMGREIARIYNNDTVTKIVTVEASGIAIAVAAANYIGVPVVFAKKNKTRNVSGNVYAAKVHSYTHNIDNTIIIPKEYINSDDKLLIIDDFLANGKAFEGLISISEQAGAQIVGCTAAVEKGYQGGGDRIREKGIRVESLAIVERMDKDGIEFRK